MGVSKNIINNCADKNQSLYIVFCEQLVTEGEMLWCQHNEIQDTVVLSDYDPSIGSLALLFYVHVTCPHTYSTTEGSYILQCTCNTYNTIQCDGLSKTLEFGANEFAVLTQILSPECTAKFTKTI